MGEGVTFPIASMFPDRVYVAQDSDDVITLLTSTASSFSFGSLYDVRQVRCGCVSYGGAEADLGCIQGADTWRGFARQPTRQRGDSLA